MKKTVLFLILLFSSLAHGQFWENPNQKPSLFGRRINRAHILGDPVGLWLFNEGSGNTVQDLSGNSITGTGTLTWGAGKFGSYVNSGIITVPDHPLLDGTATMSWSFWINAPSSAAVIYLDKYTTASGKRSWQIARKADADLTLQLSSDGEGNELQEFNLANLATGVWTHLVITFNNGTGLLYKNGVFIDTITFLVHTSLFAGSADFLIDCTNQDLDVLSIYNRVLSSSEIAQLYREPFCMIEPLWDWNLYFGMSFVPPGAGQFIFIN